jgi:hypothetical protein
MAMGILVARLGDFVREQYAEPSQPAPAVDAFPSHLAHWRELFGHHLIILGLLARADGEFAPAEQDAIVRYGLSRTGNDATESERLALCDYIAGFRPSLMQLAPAIKRLERDSADDVMALLAATRDVVDADGERRAAEVKFLAGLQDDLARAN